MRVLGEVRQGPGIGSGIRILGGRGGGRKKSERPGEGRGRGREGEKPKRRGGEVGRRKGQTLTIRYASLRNSSVISDCLRRVVGR